MNLLGKQDTKKGLTDFKDPFTSDKIRSIHMFIYKAMFAPHEPTFSAQIDFKNGNTEGTQKIEASDFPELVRKVEYFIDNLETK